MLWYEILWVVVFTLNSNMESKSKNIHPICGLGGIYVDSYLNIFIIFLNIYKLLSLIYLYL